MKRILLALATGAILIAGGTGIVEASNGPMTWAQTQACFDAHAQAGLLTLAEAEACAPAAPVLTSGSVLPTTGPAIVEQSNGYYLDVYSEPPSGSSTATAASTGCVAIGSHFATQNWWFGAFWGSYSPRGAWWYFPPSCYDWFSNMYSNGFSPTACVGCISESYTQGTYSSTWAYDHGYGYWATAWVDGFFGLPGVIINFNCRAELYPNSGFNYPGCSMS